MLIPIIAVTIFGGRGTEWGLTTFFTPIAFILLTLIIGIISWFRFTYRIEEHEIRIESGVFIKKKRYIPFERIQSLDQTEGILHRALGLVMLKVETAGGSGSREAEAVLAAITKDEANQIQGILTAVKQGESNVEDVLELPRTLIYKIKLKDLIVLAFTSGGIGVILSAVFAFFLQMDEIIPYQFLLTRFERLTSNGIMFVMMIVMVVLFFVWILAFVGTLFKYGNFTVVKSQDDLIITKGLIERRQITVPIKRIQSIKISQNLVRQPIGFASVYAENAGGSVENGELAKVILLPVVKREEVSRILGTCLPDYDLNVSLHPAPKRALIRYLLRGWLFILPIVMVPSFFLKPWGWLSFFIIIPVTCLQYLTYRDAGWGIDGDQLTLQYRRVIKNIVFMKKGKIQSINIEESFIQRKKQLSTIQALVKSGQGGAGGRVADLDHTDSAQVFKWYSYEKN